MEELETQSSHKASLCIGDLWFLKTQAAEQFFKSRMWTVCDWIQFIEAVSKKNEYQRAEHKWWRPIKCERKSGIICLRLNAKQGYGPEDTHPIYQPMPKLFRLAGKQTPQRISFKELVRGVLKGFEVDRDMDHVIEYVKRDVRSMSIWPDWAFPPLIEMIEIQHTSCLYRSVAKAIERLFNRRDTDRVTVVWLVDEGHVECVPIAPPPYTIPNRQTITATLVRVDDKTVIVE